MPLLSCLCEGVLPLPLSAANFLSSDSVNFESCTHLRLGLEFFSIRPVIFARKVFIATHRIVQLMTSGILRPSWNTRMVLGVKKTTTATFLFFETVTTFA